MRAGIEVLNLNINLMPLCGGVSQVSSLPLFTFTYLPVVMEVMVDERIVTANA